MIKRMNLLVVAFAAMALPLVSASPASASEAGGFQAGVADLRCVVTPGLVAPDGSTIVPVLRACVPTP